MLKVQFRPDEQTHASNEQTHAGDEQPYAGDEQPYANGEQSKSGATDAASLREAARGRVDNASRGTQLSQKCARARCNRYRSSEGVARSVGRRDEYEHL